MSGKQRTACWLLCLTCLFLLSGCWDNREPRRRAYVMGIGVDPVPDDPELITLTLQLPLAVKGTNKGQAGTAGTVDFVLIRGTGRSFFEASQRAQDSISRELFFGQVRTLVLSKRLSAEQYRGIVDSLMRNPDVEETIYTVVAQGGAADLMRVQTTQERFPALYLNNVFESVRRHTVTVPIQLWEFWRALQTPGWDPIAPLAKQSGRDILLNEIAVFRGAEYRGTLDSELAEGLNYFMGKTQSGVIELESANGSGTLRSIRSVRTVSYHFDRGRPVFKVKVNISGEVARPLGIDMTSTEGLAELERVASQGVTRRVMAMLKTVQGEYGADVFGLGKLLAYREPEYFNSVRWQEVFPTVRIDVETQVSVSRKGLLSSP